VRRLISPGRRIGLDLAALGATGALLAPFARLGGEWTSALGFFALVPWLWAVRRARSLRHSVVLGAGLSLVFALSMFSWFPAVGVRYTGHPLWTMWLAWLAFAPLLEPQPIAFAVVRWLVRRWSGEGMWAAAFAWIGIEWVVPRLLGDTLGYGLYGATEIRQLADLAGVRGLTLLLLTGNVLVLSAIEAVRERRRVPPSAGGGIAGAARAVFSLGILAALLASAWAYGRFRLHSAVTDHRSPLSVAVVQANLTDYIRLRRELGTYDAARTILDTHFALSDEAASAELIIWPETVYPTTYGAPKTPEAAELDERIRAFVSRRAVPLVFGAYDVDSAGEYNAAALLMPRGSAVEHARYRKVHPFPLSEWVPEAIDTPALRERFPWIGSWRPGERAGIWHARTRSGDVVRIAPLICYDAAFTSHAAEAARNGAQILATLSNDSWFSGTPAPELHLVVSAFRSIETRLPQIRAANSGVSAIIDATGTVRARTAFEERAVLEQGVRPSSSSMTLVTRWGDWLGPVALIAAAALLALPYARLQVMRRSVVRYRNSPAGQARHQL
jgi:apolipoprotein N-acyltransferase